MVEVEYQPTKKIIVHEAIKQSYNDFVKTKTRTANLNKPLSPVRWCEGVVFVYSNMPATNELINEMAYKGVLHWSGIEFAEMPDFSEVISDPNTHVQIRVIDMSNNSNVVDVIRTFKNNTAFFPTTGT